VGYGNEHTAYLLESGFLGHFVFEQLDLDRTVFKGLAFEQFKIKIDGTDLYFDSFQEYLYTNGLNMKLDKNKALVKRYLSAEFARQLYSESKYYEIVLKDDTMIKAVLK
jgi:carboxyl-terminal processing protease